MPESKREQSFQTLSPLKLSQFWQESSFFGQPFSKGYRAKNKEFGINIAEQSRKNLLRLIDELKATKKDLLTEDKNSGNELLTAKEWTLYEVWRDKLFPQMTLRHATPKVEFDTLTPINLRRKEKSSVNVIHTFGQDATRYYNYFVLGFGSHHPTPLFIGVSTDTIEVAIGQLAASSSADDLHGLFISGHLQQYSTSAQLAPVQYGGTRRHIEFDAQTKTKTYCYLYENGRSVKRTVHYSDEIFAADRNITTLSEALFYQFILELRRLGSELHQDLLSDVDDHQKIIATFHNLFESFVYPEAKLPRELNLKKPYVKIVSDTVSAKALRLRWFNAAEEFNVKGLQNCMEEASKLNLKLNNIVYEDKRTALAVAIAKSYSKDESDPRRQTIAFLLQHVDPTIKDIAGYDAACHAVLANDQHTAELLFKGVQHHENPLIYYHCHYPMERLLLLVVSHQQSRLFDFLLKKIITFTPTNAITARIYHFFPRKSAVLISACLKKGANINACFDGDGMNALHLAAKEGDAESVRFLLEQGADVNAKVSCSQPKLHIYQNQTAMHLAAMNGHFAVVEQLITAKALVDCKDSQGNTPYFVVEDKRERGIKSYVKEINEGKIFEKEVSQKAWEKHTEQLQSVQDLLALHHQPIQREKNLAQQCKYRKLHAVGLLLGTQKGKPCVVLCRRKDGRTQQAKGYYLFPGGTFDAKVGDANLEDTLVREIEEETGFRINPDHHGVHLAYSFVHIENPGDNACYVQTDFYSIQLGEGIGYIKFVANSDLAEVRVVACDQLRPRDFDATSSGYFYRGVRVQQSNKLLLEELILHDEVRNANLIRETLILESFSKREIDLILQDNNVIALQQYYYRGLELESYIARVCALNKPEMLKFMMDCGLSINYIGDMQPLIGILDGRWFLLLSGITPLMSAAACGYEELAYQLVEEYGADVNLAVAEYAPISFACYIGNEKLVEFLLAKGSVALDSNILGCALQCAIMANEDTRCVKLLLQTGRVDLNGVYAVGLNEMSPIGYAQQKGKIEIFQFLFEYGIQHGHIFNLNFNDEKTVIESLESTIHLNKMYADMNEYPNWMKKTPENIKYFQDSKQEYWSACKIVEWLVPFIKQHPENFKISDVQKQQLEVLQQELTMTSAPRSRLLRGLS
jgi:ankyrin repeat protein/8-oxo-dGTP pyrophosphatase MutT (NUDIX family)